MPRDKTNWTFIDRMCARCNIPFKAEPANVRKGQGRYCGRACARAPRQTPEERFWKYVCRTPSCWLWTGGKTTAGYGMIRVGGRGGKNVYAHIFSYELHCGAVPDGQEVCHTCDNPACVNPAHLFVDTHAGNMADAARKGRMRLPGLKGASHPRAKLSQSQVDEIRQRFSAGGIFQREIAAEYGVDQVTISRIVRGAGWKG